MNPFFSDNVDIIERAIWRNQNAKSICSIAKVTAVNESTVDVQPLIKHFDAYAGWVDCVEIKDVPVSQNQTSSHSIQTPLKVGDTGMVIWFDREVYNNLQSGAREISEPSSGKMNDLSACVFIPAITAFSKAKPLKQKGVDVVSENISLLKQLEDLCAKIKELTDQISSIVVSPGSFNVVLPGPSTVPVNGLSGPPANAAAITAIGSQITLIKNNLTTFKGDQ
jgi:hypothetical protein